MDDVWVIDWLEVAKSAFGMYGEADVVWRCLFRALTELQG
jgi:hypothetical protein